GRTATQKREHSTGLSGCKQVCPVANLACFLKRYTILCGFRLAIPTMACDGLRTSTLPSPFRNSAAMTVIRNVNCFYNLHFCAHHSELYWLAVRLQIFGEVLVGGSVALPVLRRAS